MSRVVGILFGLSLAGNVALVATWTFTRTVAGAKPVAPEAHAALADTAGTITAATTGNATNVLPPWDAIYADDPAVLAANLRAAGTPEALVRAIVGAQIAEAFAARRAALTGPEETPPYWMPRTTAASRERSQQLRALSREQQQLMTQLFGDQAISEDARYYAQQRVAFLPPEKREIIRRIESDYGELISSTMTEAFGGARLPEDREKLALLEKEKRADLAEALTPEELEAYDLRLSPTASSLRHRLGDFDATEAEFRAVFQIQRAFDEKYASALLPGPFDPTMQAQRQAEQETVNGQIREVLGAERYAAYERAADQSYRYAVRIAEHFQLPKENAIAAYELQKDYQERLRELPQFTGPQAQQERAAAHLALARQATDELAAVLTPAGADALKQTGAMWLRSLENSAIQPPPPPRGP